jgi:hypothetical protein
VTRPANILRVVVASPGDVEAERKIIPEVVDSLNRGVAANQSLRLEVYKWDTDSYPGFHPQGAQGQVDTGLRIDDCDLLVGIFWKRFGTPVSDAQSGTEHEFLRAYDGWKEKGRPQIMFYFNQKAYAPRFREETDQWGKVLEFKKNFPREGLWWAYSGPTEFEKYLRDHLTRFLLDLSPSSLEPPTSLGKPSIAGGVPPVPSLFVGREESLHELKQHLGVAPGGRTSGPMQVLTTVRGWPGVGKTSVVAALAHDPEVEKAFPDGVLWASLGEKPNLLSALAGWGRALGTEEVLRAPSLPEATAMLAAFMRKRRMLLIVDDVWEAAHVEPFRRMLGAGCALLVTTRESGIAQGLAPTPNAVYKLPVLSEKSALELLRALAPDVVNKHSQECQELVRDLECLPLALHVAGHMLNTEARMGWGVTTMLKEVRDAAKLLGKKAPTDQADFERQTTPTVAALLQKSVDRLDEFTRSCFAYMGAFAPKPATFDLAAMGAVWEVADPRPIVRVLSERGLLEPVGDGRFQMHALLVAYARSLLT